MRRETGQVGHILDGLLSTITAGAAGVFDRRSDKWVSGRLAVHGLGGVANGSKATIPNA